jgi:hypothetical protein
VAIEPEHIVSIQLWRRNLIFPVLSGSFFRAVIRIIGAKLDEGIIATHWLTRGEIKAKGTFAQPLALIA